MRDEIAAMDSVSIVGTVGWIVYHDGRAQTADLTHGQVREQGTHRDG